MQCHQPVCVLASPLYRARMKVTEGKLTLRGDTLPPKAMNAPGKLGQFGAPEPADRLIPVQLKPSHCALDSDRATPQFLDCRRKRLAQGRMWMRELPARQHL